MTEANGVSMSELLRKSTESSDQLPKRQYAPERVLALGEQGKHLHDNAQSNVNRIFDYGIAKIEKIEDLCKVARAALEGKRNAVNSSMSSYVQALVELENLTSQLDRSLSDMIVQNDAFGT